MRKEKIEATSFLKKKARMEILYSNNRPPFCLCLLSKVVWVKNSDRESPGSEVNLKLVEFFQQKQTWWFACEK